MKIDVEQGLDHPLAAAHAGQPVMNDGNLHSLPSPWRQGEQRRTKRGASLGSGREARLIFMQTPVVKGAGPEPSRAFPALFFPLSKPSSPETQPEPVGNSVNQGRSKHALPLAANGIRVPRSYGRHVRAAQAAMTGFSRFAPSVRQLRKKDFSENQWLVLSKDLSD